MEQQPSGSTQVDSWVCVLCTFENSKNHHKCEICLAVRSARSDRANAISWSRTMTLQVAALTSEVPPTPQPKLKRPHKMQPVKPKNLEATQKSPVGIRLKRNLRRRRMRAKTSGANRAITNHTIAAELLEQIDPYKFEPDVSGREDVKDSIPWASGRVSRKSARQSVDAVQGPGEVSPEIPMVRSAGSRAGSFLHLSTHYAARLQRTKEKQPEPRAVSSRLPDSFLEQLLKEGGTSAVKSGPSMENRRKSRSVGQTCVTDKPRRSRRAQPVLPPPVEAFQESDWGGRLYDWNADRDLVGADLQQSFFAGSHCIFPSVKTETSSIDPWMPSTSLAPQPHHVKTSITRRRKRPSTAVMTRAEMLAADNDVVLDNNDILWKGFADASYSAQQEMDLIGPVDLSVKHNRGRQKRRQNNSVKRSQGPPLQFPMDTKNSAFCQLSEENTVTVRRAPPKILKKKVYAPNFVVRRPLKPVVSSKPAAFQTFVVEHEGKVLEFEEMIFSDYYSSGEEEI